MPIIALIIGIVLVYMLHRLLTQAGKGGGISRYILGGGMIVSLLLASRIFGARVLYAFVPAIQRWMVGGSKGGQREASPASYSENYMSKDEAALILDIDINASKDEVKKAHKELMLKLHPDKGGNDYLAGKLNQAREIMLG